MTKRTYRKYALLLTTLFAGQAIAADITTGIDPTSSIALESVKGQWSLGLGAASVDNAYKGVDTELKPIPIVQYEGKKIFIRGFRLGYKLFSKDNFYLNAISERGLDSFDDKDSNELKGLDDRRHSYNAGLHGGWQSERGYHIRAAVLTDVSNTHNGSYANLSYGRIFGSLKEGWTITPEVGVNWISDNYANYYFGVSEEEQVRTGIKAYEAGGERSLYFKLSSTYRLTARTTLIANISYQDQGDKIYNSTMVNDRNTVSGVIGAVYHF